MSISDPMPVSEIAAQAQKLRVELKAWEKTFAAANEGRKAGRDDIKRHPDIAKLYKDYNQLRARLSFQDPLAQRTSSPASPSKKRKRPSSKTAAPPITSESRSRHPQHHPLRPADLHPYDSPHLLSTQLTPTHARTSIGPTPQKNGLVLGLFDLLSPTPTKLAPTPSKAPSQPRPIDPQATPSKTQNRTTTTTPSKHAHTLQSSTKRTSPSTFLTPSTRCLNAHQTPTSRRSTSKLLFDETPDFLRRDSQRTLFPRPCTTNTSQGDGLEGTEISFSPVTVRLPRKPAGQVLSTLVRNLRELEEEMLDEELDVLREVEAEERGESVPASKRPKLLVRDSQMRMPVGGAGEGEMPLGADGEGPSSEDEMVGKEGLGRDGRPLRVWKKKGQKRSTRRVVMKPSTAKWKPERKWEGADDGEEAVEVEAVEETQCVQGVAEETGDLEREVDVMRPEEGEPEDSQRTEKRSEGVKKEKQNSLKDTKSITKVPKKISATANPNFRALKIKNKQSKGKRGAKFSRRR